MARPLYHGLRALHGDSAHLLAACERARTDANRPKEERERLCALLTEANEIVLRGARRLQERGLLEEEEP